MTLSEFIQKYLEDHQISARAFATLVDMSPQQIGNIIRGVGNNGKQMTSTMKTYKKIAEGIGMSEQEFLNMLNDNVARSPVSVSTDVIEVPVLGSVKAGYGMDVIREYEDTEEIPASWIKGRPIDDYFMLRVIGDSMEPKYVDGDLVLVLSQTTMDHSGQIGVVMYDDNNFTLKRVEYVMGEDWMRLCPLNEKHETLTITGERLEHCRVLGIPKMMIRKIEQ